MGVTRHTKIIATLGPASSAPERLDALIAAGVDVFRLNFSHGTQRLARAGRFATSARPQRAAGGTSASCRTSAGRRSAPDRSRMVSRSSFGKVTRCGSPPATDAGGPGRVFTPYAALISSAEPGDRLLLDDGRSS